MDRHMAPAVTKNNHPPPIAISIDTSFSSSAQMNQRKIAAESAAAADRSQYKTKNLRRNGLFFFWSLIRSSEMIAKYPKKLAAETTATETTAAARVAGQK